MHIHMCTVLYNKQAEIEEGCWNLISKYFDDT